MIRKLKIYIAVLLVIGTFSLNAQTIPSDGELENQLQRLETKLQSARHLAQILNNPDLFQFINQATEQYNQAKIALQSGQRIRAANNIKRAYSYLAQFYQSFKNNERFRQRFRERLDQKIEEAERIVSQSQDPESLKLLNRAKYFRERAYQMFRNDNPEAMFRNYFIAIFFAESATRSSQGEDIKDIREFNRYLEDSKELLSQLEELSANSDNEIIKKIMQNARIELASVQRLYDQTQYKQAYQKLQIVNRFLYRALDLLESNPSAIGDRLEVDLQLLEDRLSDIRDQAISQNDENTRKMYERSLFLASSAQEKFNINDYNGARQQISMANRLLYQIHRRINKTGESSAARVKNQLKTGQIMLQALKEEEVTNPAYPQLIALLERNYTKAESEFRKGNLAAALQYLQIFNRLAVKTNQLKTVESVQQNKDENSQRSLDRLKVMLENISENGQQDELLQVKYDNAKKLYEIADDSYKKGNIELSNQISHLALNLLTQ
jgi:hypothetical protein